MQHEPGSGESKGRRPSLSLASLRGAVAPLNIGSRIRNYFLTGLIIVGPVTITLYIVWWFINLVDAWVKPLMPDFLAWLGGLLPSDYVPGWLSVFSPVVGLVFGMIALTVVGALAANLLGRTIVSYGEMFLGRMPVVRGVYSALKQIFETVLSESGNSFQTVGLVEFPRKGMWSIVFLAGESRGEISAKVGDGVPMICAFLPCTPNPTTGYLIYVPSSDVVVLEMTIEEAAKLVISAGLIMPDYKPRAGPPPIPPGTALANPVEASAGMAPRQPDRKSRTASSHSKR